MPRALPRTQDVGPRAALFSFRCRFVLLTPGCSGLDHVIPEWVQLLLPQQLLGFQVLFLLVDLVAHGPRFLELQMQGLVLLVLTDFPEVPFPSLVNDSEHTGDGSNNSDLGKFGSLGQLGQRYLRVLQLFQKLLLAAKASSVLLATAV